MTVLVVTAATLTGLVGLPLALLWALRGAGRRLARAEDHHTVGDYLPALPAAADEPGALSEEERQEQAWLTAGLARDRAGFDHFEHAWRMRLHMRVERRLRQILDGDDPDAWVRVHSGEYALVGTA